MIGDEVRIGGLQFDRSISLGNILTLATLLLTLWTQSLRLEGRLTSLETKVGLLVGNKVLASFIAYENGK